MSQRPTVSVVVPFAGTDQALAELTERLSALSLTGGDELIIADNRPGAVARGLSPTTRIHPASAVASPGFARNRGAAAASGEWIVFIDADTAPEPELLDAYFDPPPAPGTAVIAGAIEDVAEDPSFVARHVVARGQMSQSVTLGRGRYPYAQSANIAVRRDALIQAGGFEEHARAGEDADLCFRLAAAGLGIESRPHARVRHRARADLRGLLVQLLRHGSGAAWCNRRHPGSFPPPGPGGVIRRFGRCVLSAGAAAARGDRHAAGVAGLELLEALAFLLGRVVPNRPRWRPRP